MKRELTAVVFDLDDTLHDDTRAYQSAAREIAEEIAAAHGVDAEKLLAAFIDSSSRYWRALSADHLLTPISVSRLEMWTSALQAVGVADEATIHTATRRYAECRRKYYSPFPGALQLLDALRKRGMKLGLITNGFAETHYEKLELLGLERAFDAVLCADEVGMVKPDPRIFLHACELLGTAPEKTAMVGDRYFRDISGAREAGMFTVYLDVHQETIPPDKAPDASVKGIEEVLDALLP